MTIKLKSKLTKEVFLLQSNFFGKYFPSAQVHSKNRALSLNTWINFLCDCVWCNILLGHTSQNETAMKKGGMEVHPSTKHQTFKTMFICYLSTILK